MSWRAGFFCEAISLTVEEIASFPSQGLWQDAPPLRCATGGICPFRICDDFAIPQMRRRLVAQQQGNQNANLGEEAHEIVGQVELSLGTLGWRFPCWVLHDESYWAHS